MPNATNLQEVVKTLRIEGDALLACAARLEKPESPSARAIEDAVGKLESALRGGGKIVVTGVGKSGKVGQKIAATFCSTGSLSVFLHPTEGLHGDLGVVQKGDAVLAISYTGNTDELLELLPTLRSRGAAILALTGGAESRLAALADVRIDAAVAQEACPHNLAPTASTTLALALGDALAVALMRRRGFDADKFAANHPGGTLGRKLSLKVADLMHRGPALPFVGPDAPMDEVVVVSTQKKLGIALVADPEGQGGRLLGVITDGDLRRALKHREKFFTLKAREVMTAKPRSTTSDALAAEALRLMEQTPPVTALPVIEAGRCVGLVHLHDLVQKL